jgi:hypothetical protein
MQLRVARLCLDCEEVHDAQQCPVCASETFAYLSRWVQVPERRATPRPPAEVGPAPTPNGQKTRRGAMVGYGVLGLGVIGLADWFIRGRKRIEDAAARGAGDLK